MTRLLGLALFLWGAVSLALLFTPWRDLALDWSVARVASSTDRRAGNAVTTVDPLIAMVGSAIMAFTGLWIGVLVPGVIGRSARAQRAAAGL